MKVLFYSPNKTIIYLNDFEAKELNIQDQKMIEKYLKKIFIKLRKYYQLKITGYYNIFLYYDYHYGVIIELIKEETDYYYDELDTSIDMKMVIEKDCEFLYELEDPFMIDQQLLKESNMYRYHNQLYLQLIDKIDYIDLGILLENSKLVYKNTKEIIRYGKKVKEVI